MKHVVRKAFFDFEKEEKYLNDMSANGLALTNYSWCKYIFEDAPRGEYVYRLELLEKPLMDPKSLEYIQFMEEMGAEVVATYNRWVYFRRRTVDGDFDIYSDLNSKLKHYKRVRLLLLSVIILNFLIGIYNWFLGSTLTSSGHLPINTYVSIVSFSIAALLLIFIALPLVLKINTLEQEKHIHE